jgi:hypothetical protein
MFQKGLTAAIDQLEVLRSEHAAPINGNAGQR